MTPDYWEHATKDLSKRDPLMRELIRTYKGESLQTRGDMFFTLARSIAGQQISVKAADSVWKRVEALLPAITPADMLAMPPEHLRECGLSQQKIIYLQHIAEVFHRQPERVTSWHMLGDDALIRELTTLKGVGKWTAEMLMIFHYQRPDVFPLADIGVLKAIEKHYGVSRSAAHTMAEKWRPWRTVATWYLWRSLDPVPVAY